MGSRVDITEYEYKSDKVPRGFEGFKMSVLSDLHCNRIGRRNDVLVERLYKINPDIIICAGDMVSDNARHMKVTLSLMRRLTIKYRVYYACGNHELRLSLNPRTADVYREYLARLKKAGVAYLNNRSAVIKRGNEKIRITGLGIGMQFYNKVWNSVSMPDRYIGAVAGKPASDALNVLIAHNPDYFPNYAKWGADVVLSGHIHGGIAVLPYVGGVISPAFRLFPKYDFGVFRRGGSAMFLSRGLGSHTIPVRIFNNPEIMNVTLRRKSHGDTRKA